MIEIVLRTNQHAESCETIVWKNDSMGKERKVSSMDMSRDTQRALTLCL